jgi:hypothetical protein
VKRQPSSLVSFLSPVILTCLRSMYRGTRKIDDFDRLESIPGGITSALCGVASGGAQPFHFQRERLDFLACGAVVVYLQVTAMFVSTGAWTQTSWNNKTARIHHPSFFCLVSPLVRALQSRVRS